MAEQIKLGAILHMEKGKKPNAQSSEPLDGYLPYVDIKAFEQGIVDNYASVEKSLLCEDGELLIVCDGSRSGLTGYAIKGVVGSTLSKISADGLETKYLRYFIQSKYLHLNTRKKGTGTPHLNTNILKESKIWVPSIPEQERIVARIEELFSQLDAGVSELKMAKERLKVYRQAVLKEAFEGDYLRIRLGEISTVVSGYAFKSKLYTPEGKYVVVKIGNVKERRFEFSRDLTRTNEVDEAILDKYLLRRGDCLITLTGSRGKRDYGFVTMIKDQTNYLLNQRVAAIRFNAKNAIPEFFQYYLASPTYRNAFFRYETGNVGQGNVGIKALTEPIVILPDIKQQWRIVEKIESRLSICEGIEKTVDTALQQVNALRQSILKKVFEGGLV